MKEGAGARRGGGGTTYSTEQEQRSLEKNRNRDWARRITCNTTAAREKTPRLGRVSKKNHTYGNFSSPRKYPINAKLRQQQQQYSLCSSETPHSPIHRLRRLPLPRTEMPISQVPATPARIGEKKHLAARSCRGHNAIGTAPTRQAEGEQRSSGVVTHKHTKAGGGGGGRVTTLTRANSTISTSPCGGNGAAEQRVSSTVRRASGG